MLQKASFLLVLFCIVAKGQQYTTNYQTPDGQARFESIGPDGSITGQYSYTNPEGKVITLKYSAGKDGFKVDGDHLPRSPSPGAAAPAAGSFQPNQGLFHQQQGGFPQHQAVFPQQPAAFPQPVAFPQHYQQSPDAHGFAPQPFQPGLQHPGVAFSPQGGGYDFNFGK